MSSSVRTTDRSPVQGGEPGGTENEANDTAGAAVVRDQNDSEPDDGRLAEDASQTENPQDTNPTALGGALSASMIDSDASSTAVTDLDIDAGIAGALCADGVHNGEETDTDCGGACPPCAEGAFCSARDDCVSGLCVNNRCRAPRCDDGMQNGDETDIDCGAGCLPCADGGRCVGAVDCMSGVCTNQRCSSPTCQDDTLNGDEVDVDCGGTCPRCADGRNCTRDLDCLSAHCRVGLCAPQTCGDGRLALGEACDDGNDNNQDGCTNACQVARCGDGIVQSVLEACDDGNDNPNDGCTNRCTVARCGDGIVHTGREECDDGNVSANDACTNTCAFARCGDGVVRLDIEECDDGNAIDSDQCTSACARARCGDGLTQRGVEQCDDGNANNGDACLNGCIRPQCGDGYIHVGVETCDDGNAVTEDCEYGLDACSVCTSVCQVGPGRVHLCGDSVVDPQEACDDGNVETEVCDYERGACEVCSETCEIIGSPSRYCGDNNVDPEEACDHGGDVTVACPYGIPTCTVCGPDCVPVQRIGPFCGDGIKTDSEGCDDGPANTDTCPYDVGPCTLCTPDCTMQPGRSRSCGDGIVDPEEECDEGDSPTSDCPYGLTPCTVCSADCRHVPGVRHYCGDGVLDAQEECDDGNTTTEACPSWKRDCDVCASGCTLVNESSCETSDGVPILLDDALRRGVLCSEGLLRFSLAQSSACASPLVTINGAVSGELIDESGDASPFVDGPVAIGQTLVIRGGAQAEEYTIQVSSTCPVSPARLVLNEIDYQNQGPDSRDFVEIYNAGGDAADLTNVRLEISNPAGLAIREYDIGEITRQLSPGTRLVIGNAFRVAGLDAVPFLTVPPFFLPNAGGGLRLWDGDRLLDAVSYGRDVPGFVDEDRIPVDPGVARIKSLARIPDGHDTGQHQDDFKLVDHTVGRPNGMPVQDDEPVNDAELAVGQGMVAGELTSTSVILQTRLTAPGQTAQLDYVGQPGVARFEYAAENRPWQSSPWLTAVAERDFTVRHRIEGLTPGETYRWRVRFGRVAGDGSLSDHGTFQTPSGHGDDALTLVAVSCMSIRKYMAAGRDLRGFEAFDVIAQLEPNAVFFTGDTVYYDQVDEPSAIDAPSMRLHWHQTLGLPRVQKLFRRTATYWQKDDHDFRYNDADRTPGNAPSTALGLQIFREQVPTPIEPEPMWRTIRLNGLVQVWLLEGRDHRSPNNEPDGPNKTLWGDEQKQWLMDTLVESDAPIKLVVTPTPMVGPDWGFKRDNHTNALGFLTEGQAFMDWAQAEGLSERGLFLISGDRHWRYVSRHRSGLMEFGTGAIHSELAFAPPAFAGANTSDPEGLVERVFASSQRVGGFLKIDIRREDEQAVLRMDHFLYNGQLEHRYDARFPLP